MGFGTERDAGPDDGAARSAAAPDPQSAFVAPSNARADVAGEDRCPHVCVRDFGWEIDATSESCLERAVRTPHDESCAAVLRPRFALQPERRRCRGQDEHDQGHRPHAAGLPLASVHHCVRFCLREACRGQSVVCRATGRMAAMVCRSAYAVWAETLPVGLDPFETGLKMQLNDANGTVLCSDLPGAIPTSDIRS
jgi:hypothetical protein